MKVIVAKMPGGKAISVTLDEGATINDAIVAAGLGGSTDGGFEIRKNDEPAKVTDIVAHQDIIALTKKIEGNAKNTVTLQFVNADGVCAEKIEVLKDFPLNPAKLFTDIDDDNERLTVEGYILSYSDKGEYNPDDYRFAIEKEDKPLSWKPLTNRNWISSGCLVLICKKDGVPDSIIDAEHPVTADEETVNAIRKKRKKVETPKIKKSVAEATQEETAPEDKPEEKCGKKSKRIAGGKKSKRIADGCACGKQCESDTPVKLNPSPELLSELANNSNDTVVSKSAEIMSDIKDFSEYMKSRHDNVCIHGTICAAFDPAKNINSISVNF